MPYSDLEYLEDEWMGGPTYAHGRMIMRDAAKSALSEDEESEERKKKLVKKYAQSSDEELEDRRAKYAQARENVKDSEKPNWAPSRNTVLEDHLNTIESEQRQRRIDKAFDSAGRGIRDFAKHAWKNWPGKGKR